MKKFNIYRVEKEELVPLPSCSVTVEVEYLVASDLTRKKALKKVNDLFLTSGAHHRYRIRELEAGVA